MKKKVVFAGLFILLLLASNVVARVVDDGDGTVTIVGKLVIAGAPQIPNNACTEPCKTCQSWQYGLRIDYESEHCACPTFDYELGDSDGAGGYFPGQNVNGILLMHSGCEACEEYCNADDLYAIRLHIIAPASGVYFTNCNFTNPGNKHSRSVDQNGDQLVAVDGEQKIYISSHPDPSDGCTTFCVNSYGANTVDYALEYHAIQHTLYDLNENSSAPCCLSCLDGGVHSIQTSYASFLQTNKPLLLIDIPTFVYDPNFVWGGDSVIVLVQIISDQGNGSELLLCEGSVLIGTFE